MKKYQATIKINGQIIRTVVFADSDVHARLILQYQFGMKSVLNTPTIANEGLIGYVLFDDLVNSIKPKSTTLSPIRPNKPLDPQKARIAVLQRQKANITKNIDAERQRQKITKSNQRIFNLSR